MSISSAGALRSRVVVMFSYPYASTNKDARARITERDLILLINYYIII